MRADFASERAGPEALCEARVPALFLRFPGPEQRGSDLPALTGGQVCSMVHLCSDFLVRLCCTSAERKRGAPCSQIIKREKARQRKQTGRDFLRSSYRVLYLRPSLSCFSRASVWYAAIFQRPARLLLKLLSLTGRDLPLRPRSSFPWRQLFWLFSRKEGGGLGFSGKGKPPVTQGGEQREKRFS